MWIWYYFRYQLVPKSTSHKQKWREKKKSFGNVTQWIRKLTNIISHNIANKYKRCQNENIDVTTSQISISPRRAHQCKNIESTILCLMLDKCRSLRRRLSRGCYLLDYGSLFTQNRKNTPLSPTLLSFAYASHGMWKLLPHACYARIMSMMKPPSGGPVMFWENN